MPATTERGIPPGQRDLRGDAAVHPLVLDLLLRQPAVREATNATLSAACAAAHADFNLSNCAI